MPYSPSVGRSPSSISTTSSAVADLSAQRVNGGNAQLQPQRTWEIRASVDHPLLGDGLLKLDLGHDQVSLLQDRILICDPDHPDDPTLCFDAPGNIGTGGATSRS